MVWSARVTVTSWSGAQGLHELLNADPGALLQVARDGEGCEHDREVGLDRLPLVVEHRPCA